MTAHSGRKAMLMASVMMAGAAYLSYASGLLSSILAARLLGPHDYGTYAYVIWMAGVAVTIVNHGLPVTAIKFVSESVGAGRQDLAASFHGWLRKAHRLSLLVLGGGVFVFLLARPPGTWAGHVLLFATIVLIGAFAKGTYLFNISVSKGYGIFSVEAKTVAMLSVSNLLALVVAWWVGMSLQGMLMVYAVISLGYWLGSVLLMRSQPVLSSRVPLPAEGRARLVHHLGWTIILTGVAVFNEGSVNIYALNRFVGAADVGYYTIATGLTKAGMDLLTVGLTSVLMSSMGHAAGKGGAEDLSRVFRSAVKNYHFFGTLLAGLGILASDWVVDFLYGSRYHAAIPIMRVMFVMGGLTLCDGVFTTLLAVADRQRARVMVTGFSLLLTTPISYLLIMWHGLQGAIWGYALVRLIVFTVAVTSAPRLVKVRPPWWDMVKLMFGMGLALPLPWLFCQWVPGMATGIVACIVLTLVYVAIVTRMKLWEPSELTPIVQLVQRVPAAIQVLKLVVPAALLDAAIRG